MRPILSNIQAHFKLEKKEDPMNFKDSKKIISCVCNYCKKKWVFYNTTKMRIHLVKQCLEISPIIKASLTASFVDSNANETIREDSEDKINEIEMQCEETSSAQSQNKFQEKSQEQNKVEKRKQANILSFADKMDVQQNDRLNELLARAIYASGTPLSIVNSKHWLCFFKALRPSYQLPSLYQVSQPLLNEEYERVTFMCQEKFKNSQALSLCCDGWINIKGEGVVNFIICTPEPVFYKSIHPKEKKETAVFISTEIITILKEIGCEKFMAVVTDNAANMKAAWKIITDQYPNITCFGCAPHGLNLLIRDIMKVQFLKSLIQQLKTIIKSIKNSHVALAIFTQKQKEIYEQKFVTLKLPSNTRFSGFLILAESAYKNKAALQATVIDESVKFDKKVRDNILDNDEFWPKIEALINLLRPIARCILLLESDNATIADVPQVLASMKKYIKDVLENSLLCSDDIEYIEKAVCSRIEFICRPIHYAANLLHPEYRGNVLTSKLTNQAIEFISNWCLHFNMDNGLILANLAEYRSKDGIWKEKFEANGAVHSIWTAAKYTKPYVWWKGLCDNQPLTPLASRILEIIPSAASCERVWSAYDGIHNKKRNRLSCDKVDKLVTIRWNLNLLTIDETKTKKQKREKWQEILEFTKGDACKLMLETDNLNESETMSETYNFLSSDSESLESESDFD